MSARSPPQADPVARKFSSLFEGGRGRRWGLSDREKKNGSGSHTSPELFQPHKKISVFGIKGSAFSKKIAEFYRKGLSINDIHRQTGTAPSTIRDFLVREGVELRPTRIAQATPTWSAPGKLNVRPPYGFCYFQGRVVPDQREHENLLLIHRLWREGMNPNAIADRLNAKRIPPRSAKAWNRNSIANILERFKSETIVIKGDICELR